MAATLAQIIGVEQGVRASTEQWWKLVAASLQNQTLLTGREETYKPEEGQLPQPSKVQKVQLNATELLEEARGKLSRYFDVTATKDWANTGDSGARADVRLDGNLILENAPATFLLFLDKRLAELAADIRKIPAQSLAEDWQPSTEPGIWRTPQERSPSTRKITIHQVITQPTQWQAAEIREVHDDVIAGWWTKVKFTSAPTAARLKELADRIARLREAVQLAIHDANRIEITDQHVSGAILGYIFDGQG